MPNNEFITPLGCTSPYITIDNVDEDCQELAPLSEVKYLLLSDGTQSPLVVPTDWTLTADWGLVIDNAQNDGTKIKQLLGIGNVEVGDPAVVQMAAHKSNQGETTYTLTYDVMVAAPTTAAGDPLANFLRRIQASQVKSNFWFVTMGDIMYGSPTGIVPESFVVKGPQLDRGVDARELWQIIITWKAQTAPLRIPSPI